jgi:hypothetical protein
MQHLENVTSSTICTWSLACTHEDGSLAASFAKLLAPLILYRASPCVTLYYILLCMHAEGDVEIMPIPMSIEMWPYV